MPQLAKANMPSKVPLEIHAAAHGPISGISQQPICHTAPPRLYSKRARAVAASDDDNNDFAQLRAQKQSKGSTDSNGGWPDKAPRSTPIAPVQNLPRCASAFATIDMSGALQHCHGSRNAQDPDTAFAKRFASPSHCDGPILTITSRAEDQGSIQGRTD